MMSELPEFRPWRPIPRLSRDVVVTEKIDGTNGVILVGENGSVLAGSRNKWLIDCDNFGFAAWVREHAEELRALGPGYHYGEWYGAGIQRRYDLTEKRFALFNVARWSRESVEATPPACCEVVPVIARGGLAQAVDVSLTFLLLNGSLAVPGFMRPEGIVIFHAASQALFKVTLENDEKPKGAL